MTKIKIITDATGTVSATLSEKLNPQTARQIIAALPIEARASTWGDEIYFGIPVHMEEENAQVEVEAGALAYWPPGNSLCIFFGRTPASRGEAPAAASPVNVIGKVEGNPSVFKKVRSGDTVRIEAV